MWLTKKGIVMVGSKDHLSTLEAKSLTSKTATSYTAIHRVVDGPFTQADLGYEWDGPQESEAYLLVLLEHGGMIEEVEWYVQTLDDAYDMVKHFKGSIDPIVIQGDT